MPIPSPADAGYLLFYPLAYAGLIVLVRARIGSFPATRWLDGLIVGTAVAALAAALALGPIVGAGSEGDDAWRWRPTSPIRSPTSPCSPWSSPPPPSPAGGRTAAGSCSGSASSSSPAPTSPTCCRAPREPTSKAASSTSPGRSARCSSRGAAWVPTARAPRGAARRGQPRRGRAGDGGAGRDRHPGRRTVHRGPRPSPACSPSSPCWRSSSASGSRCARARPSSSQPSAKRRPTRSPGSPTGGR